MQFDRFEAGYLIDLLRERTQSYRESIALAKSFGRAESIHIRDLQWLIRANQRIMLKIWRNRRKY
jgi:hypothetical protein